MKENDRFEQLEAVCKELHELADDAELLASGPLGVRLLELTRDLLRAVEALL